MTEEIRKASFSGHIVLEFQESLDLVIVSRGDFIKVVEKIGRRLLTTKKYREIWGKCQIKQGRMTIFELPPDLAAAMETLGKRTLLCSGDGGTCRLDVIIREQKGRQFTGFIDGVCTDGKGLLEMRGGEIVACYFTEYQGLFYQGLEAFLSWHRFLQRTGQSFTLYLSEPQAGTDIIQVWERMLTERIEEVKTPLRSSTERLFASFGQMSFQGELIFAEGEPMDKLFTIIDGTVELSRRCGGENLVLGTCGPGTVLGLSWLNSGTSPPLSATASSNCRFLAFDRTRMEQVLQNSPHLSATLIRKAASQLRGVRSTEKLFRANPRLMDLESYVVQILNHDTARRADGLPPGELFQELAQMAPFSLSEMDQMVRDLVGAERLNLTEGRVRLRPEDI
jgi:CRP-like cAMP-binding protein